MCYGTVDLESTPGLTRQDARHVLPHLCYVSSNKLKLGAISSRLITVQFVLFYKPPWGFGEVSFWLEPENTVSYLNEYRQTQKKT